MWFFFPTTDKFCIYIFSLLTISFWDTTAKLTNEWILWMMHTCVCVHMQVMEFVKDWLGLIFLLQIVHKMNHIFENLFCICRCWTCLWLLLWTTSTIWREIHPYWVLTTWTSLSEYGPSMIQMLRECIVHIPFIKSYACLNGKKHLLKTPLR